MKSLILLILFLPLIAHSNKKLHKISPANASIKIKNPKKIGIGEWDIDKLGTSRKLIEDIGFSWYYTWKTKPLYSTSDFKIPFIPMIWNQDNVNSSTIEKNEILLGFNEHDSHKQANMSVDLAIECGLS